MVSVSFEPLAELPDAPRAPLDPAGSLDVSVPGPGWLPVSLGSLPVLPTPVPAPALADWANAAPPASIPDSRKAIIVVFVFFIGNPFLSLTRLIFVVDVMSTPWGFQLPYHLGSLRPIPCMIERRS